MATVKLTVTLPEEQIQEIRALIETGHAESVSGFVQHAVRIALHDAAGWRELLGQALDQTGGPLTNKERQWADAVLNKEERKKHPRKKNAA